MPATAANDESTSEQGAAAARLKYAIKTALSLTLAYLIPMSMGWSQPQTAAITVMLIAATGLVSDSLQKGVLRVLGTVAGAVIGLTLIALFPQERMTYLLAVSITVSLIAYLYNAYHGDNSVFMLTAVVVLMVFNGGDAEGAFLYGVDRAFMTAFGVIVYTVIAATLWPVKAVDNTRQLAANLASEYRRVFALLVHPVEQGPTNNDEQLADLLVSEEAFQAHFAAVRGSADRVAAYRAEWDTVVNCYRELQAILLPALQQETRQGVTFEHYLENHSQVVKQVEAMFCQVETSWREQASEQSFEIMPVVYKPQSLRDAHHITVAAVAARSEVLEKIQGVLLDLLNALDSMLFDRGTFVPRDTGPGKPAFVWLDQENIKTALRVFVTFWMAAALWINFNPPGGFTFVTLSTVLVLMVSYTPVAPKLLYILFSLGFLFALPAYVFLLPQLTHWLELAAFMFCYAFVGFYLFQGPVSLFFLLGLFALGIQNTMSYNMDVILLVVLTFYLMCTLLIVTVHFPFTSKPEKLYTSLSRRFFHKCANILEVATDFRPGRRPLPADDGSSLLAKLHAWGGRIDTSYFPANDTQKVAQLNQACDLLQGQMQVLLMRREEFAGNRLVVASRSRDNTSLLVELCEALAGATGSTINSAFDTVDARLLDVRERLDDLRQAQQLEKYERAELAQFFVYLNLQVSVLTSIRACQQARQALDWQQLAGSRF
jgi:uncharacterized membrane protein YgaE (UPF0421/DUF939 family)